MIVYPEDVPGSQQQNQEWASIVHQLRSRGWSKLDAEQEADNLIAERQQRRNENAR